MQAGGVPGAPGPAPVPADASGQPAVPAVGEEYYSKLHHSQQLLKPRAHLSGKILCTASLFASQTRCHGEKLLE